MRPHSLLLFLLLFTAAHAQWELMTPIKTRSEFEAIRMVNDQVGYAIDKPMGAILRTHDGGATWERLYNSLQNSPCALFMWDEERGIIVGESGTVFLTEDGFDNITTSVNPTYGEFSCVHFVNDTLGWAGTLTGKIYRSINGGANWTLTNSGQPSSNYMTAIQFLDTEVGYASCYAGEMLKSTDGGLNWQGVGPFDQVVLVRDFHFYDTELGVGVGSAGEVIRTTDGGASWDSIPSNTTYTMFDLEAQGNTMVAVGSWGRVIRSTDAGLTWTEQQVGLVEHKSVTITANGVGFIGTDGGLNHTDDFGATWQLWHAGTWHTLINKMSFMNADTGVAVGWQTMGGLESGLLRTVDGGRHWKKAGTGGLGVHLTPEGIGCLGGSSGAFARTTNGFNTRTPGSGPTVAIRCTWTFDANTYIVAGGYVLGGMYRTTNGGQDWDHEDFGNISIFDLYFVNDLLGFAVGEGGISFKTIDGGITWDPMNEPMANDQFTVFFVDELHGWMGGAMSGARTIDGGDTWEVMGSIPSYTKAIYFTDADTGYAVGNSGQVVRSVDGGVTWNGFLPEILNASVGDAAWVDGMLVIGCNNGDIFRAQITCPSIAAVPVITESGGSLCTNTNGTAQWYLDGDPLPGGDAPCIIPVDAGAYTVIVTDALGCVSAPSAPVPIISTAIAPVTFTGVTRLFPNPANNAVRIERAEASPATLTLFDVQGRVVRSERISSDTGVLDISDLVPGLYTVRVASAHDAETLRLVKE